MRAHTRKPRPRPTGKTRRNLRLERLEDRRLLALTDLASITGLVFRDVTGDGFTAGEQLIGATVQLYRDSNSSGSLDSGDGAALKTATTDGNGNYRFDRLSAGTYFVEQPAQSVNGTALSRQVSSAVVIDSTKAQGLTGRNIDAFTTAQSVIAPFPLGTRANSSLAAAEALGGERDLIGMLSTGTSNDNVKLEAGGGRLLFDPTFGATGTYQVVWDGPDGKGDSLAATGLRTNGQGIDLTNSGTSTSIHLTIGVGRPNGTATVRVYTDANNWSQATVSLADTSGQSDRDYLLSLAGDFTVGAGSGATFTNVGAMTFEVVANTAAMDGHMTTITMCAPSVTTVNLNNVSTADLALAKTVTNARPKIRDNISFNLTLTNQGNNTASNVSVRDLLPAGLTFVSANASQGSYVNGTGIWTVGQVAGGANATLQITATVSNATAGVNTAEVISSSLPDPDSTPNNSNPAEDDQASVTITPSAADLSLAKSADTATPNVGANVTFTITVSNAGPDSASGVTVTDLLPPGLTFVRSTPSQGTYNSQTGLWTVGLVPISGSATLQIVTTVKQQGAQANSAQVSASDQFDPDSTPNNSVPGEDDQATVSLTPQVADLSLTKTVDNNSPNVGQNVAFTLTLNNAGPGSATNVRVRDILPAGLNFVSSVPSTGSYDSGTGIWTVGPLTAGGVATLQLSATATVAGAKANSAEVIASDQFDPDSTPNNNNAAEDDQAAVTVTSMSSDLSLTQTVDKASPNAGQNVTFTVKVANAGPDTATNVSVQDYLPAGLTYVSSNATQGTYSNASGVWTVGSIAKAATATLTLVATVQDRAAVTNAAEITAASLYDPDSTPNNHNAQEDDQAAVTVTPALADLSLTQGADTTTPNLGKNVTFTTTVRNGGPAGATGVKVSALLPTGVTFVSSSATQGQYNSATGDWTVGAVAAAGLASLQLVGKPTQLTLESRPAQVIAADQYDADSTPNNNVATEDDQALVTLTPQSADLSLTKTVDNIAPNVGEQVTFILVLNNAGPSNATNIAVRDALISGFVFVSATPSQGIFNPATSTWNAGTLTAGSNATLALVATVSGVGEKKNVAEIVAVDQFDPDSTPGNGAAGEDDIADALLTPKAVDLSLKQEIDNPTANVGQEVTFTLTVSNAGPDVATGVAISDRLPVGLTFVRATPSQGSYNSATGLWTVGSVAPSAGATMQLVASVDNMGTKTNTAEISRADQADSDSTPANNNTKEDDWTTTSVKPPVADLSLTQTATNATPNVNENTTFKITVTNAGPDMATGVAVTDVLPAGLTFVSSTPSVGAYSAANGVWSLGTLESGGKATLEIVAKATSPDVMKNTAQISAVNQVDPDSKPANDVAKEDDQATVEVAPQVVDLAVDKSGKPNPVIAGKSLTYNITVTNTGRSKATGVIVTDTLPAGVTFKSATPSQGTASAAEGVMTAQLGDLAAGAKATITLVVDVAATTLGKLENVVTVRGDQFDANTENNTFDLSTTARLPPARISGKVYVDMNGNGIQDGVEPGIAGVEMKLTGKDAEGNLITLIEITDADGVYDFDDLDPGDYTLTETQPKWFASGKATAGDERLGRLINNDQFFFRLASNDHAANYLFGEGFPFVTRRRALASSGSETA